MAEKNRENVVHIPADDVTLEGVLASPAGTRSAVIFAHGSGSSRHSPRNKFVARVLQEAGIGTLLFDLLTREEDKIYENRFDIDLLTNRLVAATRWVRKRTETANFQLGYFGASTGTASALRAAANLGKEIVAIVSRGGRPDLAMDVLGRVTAATLLIVGGRDDLVLELNRQAYALIGAEKDLKVVPGATHLFEEPGALEDVAGLASEWFTRHLLSR